LKFKDGEGVRFVTFYAQNPAPVTNDGLFYTFQGLSADEKYYVTIFWHIRTDKLPDTLKDANIQDQDAFIKQYEQYLKDTEALLHGLASNDFTPDLALLDDLAQSIQVPK
jgi:hypothetical protein